MTYKSDSEKFTFELGSKLAENLTGGETITLSGDLGAGKTVFAKGIAHGLGVNGTVVSPTFNLMNEYEGRLRLYHFDAYRLSSAAEAYEAGLTEFFGDKGGVCVIEWWENISDALAGYEKIAVTITKTDENERKIEIAEQ